VHDRDEVRGRVGLALLERDDLATIAAAMTSVAVRALYGGTPASR